MALASLYILFSPNQSGPDLFHHIDKVVHGSLFAALAGTAGWRFGRHWRVLALVAAYAAGSELIQAFALPHRSGDWRDVVADLCGAGIGWLLVSALFRREVSRRSPGLTGWAPGRVGGSRGRAPRRLPARCGRRR